jgi:polyvinyl alcohol dehydrogenase (cytochrome)
VSGASGGEQTPVGDGDWTMMGYDLGSTYFNTAETTISRDNAANLRELWTANMGGNVYGAPLQVGDVIYASGPSRVQAFDAATGNERWTHQVTSTSSLAYADGTLYLNNGASDIVSIDAETGNENWKVELNPDAGSDGSSSVVVAGDLILCGGSNGSIELLGGSFRGFLAALDRATGNQAWVSYTVPQGVDGASIWSTPAADLSAGRAYASTGNNYGSPASDTSDAFLAFDLSDGTMIWKNQRVMNDTFGGIGGRGPDADFGANPVLYETMVGGAMTKVLAAGNKGGQAHAVRAEDGMLLWSRELCSGSADGSRGIFTNSAWTGSHMLFGCNEGTGSATLYALDGASGDIAWMKSLSGQVWGRTAVANGVAFVGAGRQLEVIDVETGDTIKSFQSKGGSVAGTITVAHGRVAFGEGLSWSSGSRGSTLTVLGLP